MNILLPTAIQATMPTQYVQHLDNPSVASVDTAPEITDHSIEIVVTDTELRWQYGSTRLRIDVNALNFASLTTGSHGPNHFAFFSLHFGDADNGGVRMLNAPIRDVSDFAGVVASLKALLPCPVQDLTDKTDS